ncbi:carbohydrate ABC transporter permease [Evansella cellulosilytica]|uniref:Binding-protein-dependent transport systems inner membrane component n=1 Tax=Evansella cellulosilytica (strain ATCC 21833 / DSM 2522 / FERM P-1141 / JCM 9156 / N-4) TaxID=649639 RepID=E6TTH6_EVAC2|nr:sugar ABC transporter permease [Evansella cellulosilytica]ADU29612.1 binding-protein-dependent transport systems inner membrane component [Evansella cellulosilytica DSM 2522]
MKSKKSFVQKNWVAYLFLSPWLLGIIGLTAIPMGASLYFSFTRYDMFTSPEWIGLSNYVALFEDQKWRNSVSVTLKYVFIGVPLQLLFALSIAALLNKGIRGVRFYRAIYYVPSLFGGSVAIAILWRQIFGGSGLVNNFLDFFGIQGINWISTPSTALYTLIVLMIWQFGASMVIFLAGLKQVPTELYEASLIDGAGKFKQFTSITLPLITPIVFFNLVMGIINAFQAFTPAYIVSGGSGGPLDSTLFYTLYLYQRAFTHFSMGYASAMAWVLLLAISFVTALIFLSSRKWVFYQQ